MSAAVSKFRTLLPVDLGGDIGEVEVGETISLDAKAGAQLSAAGAVEPADAKPKGKAKAGDKGDGSESEGAE